MNVWSTYYFFGSQKYTEIDNSHIINATINYLFDSERFIGLILEFKIHFDFDYIYSWLILDFLFIFNHNAYDKLLGQSSGIVTFYIYVSFCCKYML